MNEHRPVDADRDPERDAWLQSALAHAPDAGLEAPPAVSAAILRAAADRVSPVASTGAWSWLMRAWATLAHPPLAAGLASVLIASVVGVMWWQRPIDEAMPRPAPTLRGESAPAATPAVEPTAERAANPAAERADAAPPAASPAASPATDLLAHKAPATRDEARRPATAPTAGATPETANREAAAASQGLRDQAAARTSEEAVAAAEPAAATAPGSEAARSKGAAGRSAVAAAPAMAMRSPAMDLLQRWDLAQSRWRWKPPQAPDWQPADAAARAWLIRVEQATRGRWSLLVERAAATGAAVAVQWQQDEVLQGTLTFEAEGMRWIAPDGSIFFAPLPTVTLDALRAY